MAPAGTSSIQTDALPFAVLDLLGRDRLPGQWEPVFTGDGDGPRIERRRWRGVGTIDDRPITIHVYARLCDGRVWAVGIHAEEFVFGLEPDAAHGAQLVAIPRAPDADRRLVNWITREGTTYVELGLAF